METGRFDKWLRRLRVTATFVYIAALCVAVAVLVIAFIPHSPVPTALPAADVPGLNHVSGLAAGVTVDPAARSPSRSPSRPPPNGSSTSSSCCPAWPWSH